MGSDPIKASRPRLLEREVVEEVEGGTGSGAVVAAEGREEVVEGGRTSEADLSSRTLPLHFAPATAALALGWGWREKRAEGRAVGTGYWAVGTGPWAPCAQERAAGEQQIKRRTDRAPVNQ